MSSQNRSGPLVESQHHVINPTNPSRALDNGVEDRLHVRGRPADDPEHFGSCSLMFQSFAQFRVALLKLLEQPHIFDGDNCLVSKGLEKRDLLVGKRFDLCAPNYDNSDRDVFTKQRCGKYGPSPSLHSSSPGLRREFLGCSWRSCTWIV